MWLRLGLLFPDNTVASSDCNYGINPNLNARAANKAASRYHYVIVGLLHCLALSSLWRTFLSKIGRTAEALKWNAWLNIQWHFLWKNGTIMWRKKENKRERQRQTHCNVKKENVCKRERERDKHIDRQIESFKQQDAWLISKYSKWF